MSESTQHKLDRVRKPRVHITYDVETGDAMEKKDLPFIVGVMGDFSGDPTEPLKPLKARNFVQIDRDNFDDIMQRMNVGLNLKVDNKLQDDDTQISVDLKFKSMEDFTPANIVKQVEPLKQLMETRNRLKTLQALASKSDDLEDALEEALKVTQKQKKKD